MQGQTNQSILKPRLQRRLRNAATDAERWLWRHLRLRQLGGFKFRRQHPFGDFVLDFVCLDRKVVVEVDGSQHVLQSAADAARTAALQAAGFMVVRFWNNQVLKDIDGVLETVLQVLESDRQHHPHPSPPLEGEGEDREGI